MIKPQYLNLVQKVGTFLVSAVSIVESDRAYSGPLRIVFENFGNKKLTRLDIYVNKYVNRFKRNPF